MHKCALSLNWSEVLTREVLTREVLTREVLTREVLTCEVLTCERRQTEDSHYEEHQGCLYGPGVIEGRKWKFFMLLWTMLSNFKRVFLETMFLKSPLYKTLILIIRLTWNLLCIFELNVVTAWTKDFLMIWIIFQFTTKKHRNFSEKTTFFFTTPLFSKKLLFFIFF